MQIAYYITPTSISKIYYKPCQSINLFPYFARFLIPHLVFIRTFFFLFQAVSDDMLVELKACFMEAYDDNQDGKIDIREVCYKLSFTLY